MLLTLLSVIPVLLPANLQDAPRQARIANEDTTIHCFYDKSAEVVAILPKSAPVKVVREKKPWSRVYVPGGLDVWIHSDYVDQKSGVATVNVPRLNARPLPNTESRSQVLGVLTKGTEVVVLLEEEGWLHVRAGEEDMGAWVLTAHLDFDSVGVAWAENWATLAENRAVVALPRPVEETLPSAGDEPTAENAVDLAEKETVGLDRIENPGGLELPDFLSADVAKDPHAHLLRTSVILAKMAADVPKNLDAYDAEKLDRMEMIFGTIIWHSSVQKDLDDARLALGKIDALRRFYEAALAAESRRASLANEAAAAEAAAKARAESSRPRPRTALESYIEVGWLEFRPAVNRAYPFAVSRSGRNAIIHSYDGRYNLRDFVGREVAVRGIWRKSEKSAEPRVLAVTELRVLPLRKTTTP